MQLLPCSIRQVILLTNVGILAPNCWTCIRGGGGGRGARRRRRRADRGRGRRERGERRRGGRTRRIPDRIVGLYRGWLGNALSMECLSRGMLIRESGTRQALGMFGKAQGGTNFSRNTKKVPRKVKSCVADQYQLFLGLV